MGYVLFNQASQEVAAMDNPFKIRAGEILTLDQIFERYLDWHHWNRDQERTALRPGCDPKLHNGHLCCEDHLAVIAETAVLFRYLFHLTWDREVRNATGFSQYSMASFIKRHKINVDAAKAARYHGLPPEEWRAYMEEDFD